MSLVIETKIMPIGYDEVVDESDVHSLCGTLYDLCQAKVVIAGTYVP